MQPTWPESEAVAKAPKSRKQHTFHKVLISNAKAPRSRKNILFIKGVTTRFGHVKFLGMDKDLWEFPKIRGTLFGVLIIGIPLFRVLY